jgi:hypothetical protein
MPAIALKAHYDGQQILLDEKFDLPVNAQLLITVLPIKADSNPEPWLAIATESLARAYADDEPEYTLEDIKQ